MSDRHAGYVVVLERDVKDEDAEPIVNALRMVKGVLSVEAIIAGPDLHIAQERVRWELMEKLLDVVKP